MKIKESNSVLLIENDLLENPGLNRTLLGDGVGSMAGAFFGGCPNTTYGESEVITIGSVFTIDTDLAKNLKSSGYCILSGFIDEQTSDVISAHERQGLKLIKLYSLDNWRAALMQKVN